MVWFDVLRLLRIPIILIIESYSVLISKTPISSAEAMICSTNNSESAFDRHMESLNQRF